LRRFDPEPVSHSPGILRHAGARTRLLAALILLVGISVGRDATVFVPVALTILTGLTLARVRPRPLLVRTLAITAVPMSFVLLNYLMGETGRAYLLLTRSLLSAGVLIVLTAVTPLPELSGALSRLGTPEVLTQTIQLVYRYLFVLTDQAIRMRDAVSCRGGSGSLLAAGGTVGVLFARSYARAEGVHRAMLSRGYTGSLPGTTGSRLKAADVLLIAICTAASFAGRGIDALR
jgi:cobalt/nickel transport system permease protein